MLLEVPEGNSSRFCIEQHMLSTAMMCWKFLTQQDQAIMSDTGSIVSSSLIQQTSAHGLIRRSHVGNASRAAHPKE